jgi:hypothetical protein
MDNLLKIIGKTVVRVQTREFSDTNYDQRLAIHQIWFSDGSYVEFDAARGQGDHNACPTAEYHPPQGEE